MKRIATVLMLAATAAAAAAEPNVALYQLQERCGKRAEEIFRHDWGREPLANFQAHYNVRLNRCFVIERSSSGGMSTQVLFDANENKEYGSCTRSFEKTQWFMCSVGETACN